MAIIKLTSFLLLVVAIQSCCAYRIRSAKNNKEVECGRINDPPTDSFIIGGNESYPNKYPWMANLRMDGQFQCGLGLISDQWLITAAHCIDYVGVTYSVYLGAHDITQDEEPNRIHVEVEEYIKHPGYSFPDNDIGVVKLKEKVEFNDYIRPICLPNKEEAEQTFNGEPVRLIGWGQADNANGEEGLREVDVVTLTDDEEQEFCPEESVICLNTNFGTVGVCFGDSGSPLNYQRENGQYITIGAASFVWGGCQEETGLPHGYSRLTANLDWVLETTGLDNDN